MAPRAGLTLAFTSDGEVQRGRSARDINGAQVLLLATPLTVKTEPRKPGDERAVSLRPLARSGSLRSQLLTGLAVLLLIALLAVAMVILFWLPLGLSGNGLAVALFLLIAVDLALLLLFGDYLLRHLVLQPVDRMLEASERIAGGDDGVRLEVGGADELRRLSESVNRMADKLIRNQGMLADNIRSLDETNRQLMEARAELIHVEKMASAGRLAAGLAHEIGNPLGAILGYADVAKSRDSGGEWHEGVREEAKRIDRIVRGLLDYARPKAAAVKPVDVNDVVRQTLDLVETQGRLKGISLNTMLADEVPEVLADRFQLEQVLVNLLLNATDSIAEANTDGVITVRTRRVVHRYPDAPPQPRRKDDPEGVDYSHLRRMREPPAAFQPSPLKEGALIARIEIADNGAGLQPDEAQRMFDPFYTTKAPGQGTGLGLAVSARLIDGMRGQIQAEENPDGGAVFSISLPAIDGDEVMERQEAQEASG